MSFTSLLVFGIIAFLVLAFIACAILFPELVGIAGRRAKEIEDGHHRESSNPKDNASPTDRNIP